MHRTRTIAGRRARKTAATGPLATLAATLLCACQVVSPPPTPAAPPSLNLLSLPWSHTWSGDAEQLAIERPDNALQITFTGKQRINGKGDVVLTPVLGWAITPESTITLQLAASGADVEFALAVKTDQYYESPRRRVPAATNTTVVFNLAASDFKSHLSQWRHTDTIERRALLETVELVLYPASGQSHTLLIQSATLDHGRPPMIPTRPQAAKLALLALAPGAPQVPRFSLHEVSARIAPAYDNPFDPDDVRLDAVFVSPSGEERVCPAFLFAWAQGTEGDEWRARFSPDEEGEWTWTLRGAAADQAFTSQTQKFVCASSSAHGPVRVAREHPTLFEHADRTFFYPLGHNVCWNSLREYEEQFELMGRNGENWSRIWIAAWNCDIEWTANRSGYGGLGRYNLDNAAKLDLIVNLAERHGLYLQLVLHEHCRVSARTNPEWHNNPYNRALGGPCDQPRDFFTHEEARRFTRNRLRYIVARWGYSSHVLAWELFNEVDLSDDFEFNADTAWHKEMSEYLHAVDPHRHPVCTSYMSRPNANVCRMASIDYLQSHIYLPDIVRAFHQLYEAYQPFGKPHFIGEFGRHTQDGVDAADSEGRLLHAGLWTQFMLPSGGNAMSWWWYDLIHPRNLYRRFAALARFAEGLDRRRHDWQRQTGRAADDHDHRWHVLALTDANAVMLWMYDPEIFPWSEKPMSATAGFSGTLVIEQAGDGPWTVEQWDPHEGRCLNTFALQAADGVLRIPVESARPDAALRLTRKEPARGGETPRLVLQAWNPASESTRPREHIGIPSLKLPVSIDGDLSDWANFPAVSFAPADGTPPEDHSLAFSLGHDGEHLYVAARVTDDAVVRRNHGEPLWKDDGLELWIDSRFDGGYFCNMPNNPGCYQINLAPAAGDPYPLEHIIYRHPTLEHTRLAGIEAASRLTGTGYEMEVKVPLAVLRAGVPADEMGRIGLNLSSCDADPTNGDPSWQHLLWQGVEEFDAAQWSVATFEE
ncbi:MAG: DUF5060 domain-containing protein [Kiritimatiellae bacterium]|nr:DUF5060 domain-containing protein [Kiritimatiellia bacterium]